ncbi:MAG: chlorophyll A-B-binding protein [Leptolyngbyaceae cyanobacterium SM1_1_3]|nr:chlorophyll A-B-binding protein [Leptolyngbyaceae cyanobacterium SM1_1_3]NJN03272.1 chlorophyll A-B-binding protein [Leptolyngbyaceae cyanobacterium RM1_1_2]NJO11791.1 chlorophyll A-B-binding protein [Leptolyngbyaceae cyanobacterium SL_1_1]
MSQEIPEFEAQTSTPNQPDPEPQADRLQPAFGWSPYAERLNGRFAMIGFVSLLLLELITHENFLTWLGRSR